MTDGRKPHVPKVELEPRRKVEVPTARITPKVVGLDGPPIRDDISPTPPLGKTRADFRGEEFIRTIEQHGKRVIWRKALDCPCRTTTTEQADPNCPLCDGSGFYYVDPIEIPALMLSFDKSTRIFEKFAMWVEGNATATVRPEHRLGFRDSLEMRDSLISFGEILTRGNRRGIRAGLPAGVDSARYRIANVTRIVVLSADGTRAIPLEADAHYRLTDEGWIRWLRDADAVLASGARYSIRYEFRPTYVVTSFPHATRDDTSGRKVAKGDYRVIALPVQAAVKLDYLLDVNGPNPPVTGGFG